MKPAAAIAPFDTLTPTILTYGAKVLLNTATLRLKCGHHYGLCDKNGISKSTLMGEIPNGQVEGFPSPDEVHAFYVEHDIDGSEENTSVLQSVLSDEHILADEKEIVEMLTSVGFSDERQQHVIGSLSGGWKMKLALARAMLFKADTLCSMSRPTTWTSSMSPGWRTTSPASLTALPSWGNLQSFVKQVLEAKSYYTLEAAEDYKFKLPDPPLLEDVKTKETSLLKTRKVGFQYPRSPCSSCTTSHSKSLKSCVAILGPSGSGKSTLVKLLTCEMESNKGGEVWKHPNLVIGYVAQHAFHHIDHHLDKTPLEYILWRYQTGEDVEEMSKANRQISEEEHQKMKDGSLIVIEGQKRIIDEITNRKKLKQSYKYEVSFKGLSTSENIWLPRDDFVKRGFEKIDDVSVLEPDEQGKEVKMSKSEEDMLAGYLAAMRGGWLRSRRLASLRLTTTFYIALDMLTLNCALTTITYHAPSVVEGLSSAIMLQVHGLLMAFSYCRDCWQVLDSMMNILEFQFRHHIHAQSLQHTFIVFLAKAT
ncbi:hypothetical protein EW146_g7554 [Bondarzewia mesenterica]|uniref:ABC transporter domain-containing protein n=1 Tax=Bondarzewia mesenterica TaxID=1095465 RepID=A0A4S4LL33_9AGAM|nr:hypothetical protein EW146_g7554 [Bondarzewia mesenterica]